MMYDSGNKDKGSIASALEINHTYNLIFFSYAFSQSFYNLFNFSCLSPFV